MSGTMRWLFARETLLDGGYALSTNHLARALSGLGHDVFWMTRPLTPMSALGTQGRRTLPARLRIWGRHWSADPGPQICVWTGLARKREIGLTGGWLLRNLFSVTWPSVRSALGRRGLREVDLLCLSDPIQVGLRRVVPHRSLMFQVTDDYAEFDNYGEDVGAELHAALRDCDAVVFTNDELRRLYVERHDLDPARCHYVSHGIARTDIREDVPPGDSIRAVFVGNINDWIDWEWLEELASKLPKLRITFHGPIAPECAWRMHHPSFEYAGYLEPDRLCETLAGFHIGLIPFRRSRLKNTSDPMKLYDYAACGLPTVSSIPVNRVFEQAFPTGLKVAADADEAWRFVGNGMRDYAAFRRSHAAHCREFVTANSWTRRAEQLVAAATPALDGATRPR